MTAWVHANLDAEVQWARRAGMPVRNLTQPAIARASLLGTLLRALWPEATHVWTLGTVDPRCVRDVPGLLPPEYLSGALPDTPAMGTWADADSDAAMHANDRRLAYEIAADVGVALPGSALVTSESQVRELVSTTPRWVCKTPFGTAGRGLLLAEHTTEAQVFAALRTFGVLVFEPWHERVRDVGLVTATDATVSTTHEILCDDRGRFQGIVCTRKDPPEIAGMSHVADVVQDRLVTSGYDGPFGIDAFRTVDGLDVPLCEINARYTFGHVAHALMERVAPSDWTSCTLRFGDAPERRDDRTIPLLGSSDATRMTAWLEAQ